MFEVGDMVRILPLYDGPNVGKKGEILSLPGSVSRTDSYFDVWVRGIGETLLLLEDEMELWDGI